MGWGRTFLLGDIGNRLDIADAEQSIRELRRRVHSGARTDLEQNQRLAELEQENGELKLYLASFVGLLVEKGVLTREEVAQFVEIIDEDGPAPPAP